MPRTSAAAALTSAALVAALLCGCGAESGPAASATTASAHALPEGSVRVRAEHHGLSFGVPAGMVDVTAKVRGRSAQHPAVQELARRSGFSAAQLLEEAERTDLYLIQPRRQGGGPLTTVSVSRESSDLGGRPPADQDLVETIADLHATPGPYRSFTGATGQGGMMGFSLKTEGQALHGVLMVVPDRDGKLATISTYAPDQRTAEKIARTMSRTVAPL